MNSKDIIDIAIEYLKHKQCITDLERDILSTENILKSEPFDYDAACKKIMENNTKHLDIYTAINAAPNIETKPIEQLSKNEAINSLWLQLNAMCVKYQALM